MFVEFEGYRRRRPFSGSDHGGGGGGGGGDRGEGQWEVERWI